MRTKTSFKKNAILSNKKSPSSNAIFKSNIVKNQTVLPEILFVTSYPPRECGIATNSQDLIFALNNKFKKSFDIKICALENKNDIHIYDQQVDYVLETDQKQSYLTLANDINSDKHLSLVLIQHEFGLFKTNESDFIAFLNSLDKPIIVAFHTVLPNPNAELKLNVQSINDAVASIIVMTNAAAALLVNDYGINKDKIAVISHGTHLVEHSNKQELKQKYHFENRKTIATFGLLSSGKCIETSIDALQQIVKIHPEVMFLVIGKTHPNVFKQEGEKYREMLQEKIKGLKLE